MSENNGNEFGAFLAGFVIGGLVGAATALILAPQSGQEVRSEIMHRGQALQQAGGSRFQEYRNTAVSSLADTRERVQEVGGQVQEQMRIVLDTGREQATKVREQVSSATQELGSSAAEMAESAAETIADAGAAAESAADNAAETIAPDDGDAAEEPKSTD